MTPEQKKGEHGVVETVVVNGVVVNKDDAKDDKAADKAKSFPATSNLKGN